MAAAIPLLLTGMLGVVEAKAWIGRGTCFRPELPVEAQLEDAAADGAP